MDVRGERLPEGSLVRRCLAGEREAWRQVHGRFAPFVAWHVRRLLGPRRRNRELADELCERVWCALLVPDHRRFQAFDPRRGSLATFLAALAREQVRLHRRAERGQLLRQAPLRPGPLGFWPTAGDVEALLREFLEVLPPALRQYCLHCLQSGSAAGGTRTTVTDRDRKMQQRVREKLREFMQTR